MDKPLTRSDPPLCPVCGTPLPSDAPEGFCPHCSFGGALEAKPEAGGQRTEDRGQRTEDRGQRTEDGDPRSEISADLQPSIANESAAAPKIGNRKSEIANRFADYELLEEIAHGGMGVVFKARQRSLDRIVAIKMLLFGPQAKPELIKRFLAEATAAASLQHPNIVSVHEVGVGEKGEHYLVMEYVEGQNLAQLVGQAPLPARRAARYLQSIADAIHYAHERGVLHRDLKPSNVLIDADDQPRVTDFGLAKRFDGESELTLSGQVVGSPGYLPPEQAEVKRGKVSRRSDVYGLGSILYHLLTGRAPFQAEALPDVLHQPLTTEPVAPRLLNPTVPRDLETICLKCLEKEPARRYRTAQMVAQELGRFLSGEPVLARPLGSAGKVWRWCRRKPQTASFAAVAMLTFLLGFAGVAWQWSHSEAHRRRAEANEYVLAINVAQQALKLNNPGRALELLNRHRPGTSSLSILNPQPSTDFRGFEWRYLWQQCETEAEFVGRLPSGIRCLEVSRDGRWLVASSARGGVTVWHLASREEIPLVPERGVKSFGAFSPDSRLLLFTDQGLESFGTIRVWETQTREHLPPISDPNAVGPMAFSPDGTWFGYGVCDRNFNLKLVLLDSFSRRKIAEMNKLSGLTGHFHGFEWVMTPDSRSVIFSENAPDGRIGLWNFLTGTEPKYFTNHGEAIIAMAISQNGRVMAMQKEDRHVAVWDLTSRRLRTGDWVEVALAPTQAAHVFSADLSPDGRRLATGGSNAKDAVKLWDLATQRELRTLQGEGAWFVHVAFSPDGSTLMGTSWAGVAHLWRAPSWEEIAAVEKGKVTP